MVVRVKGTKICESCIYWSGWAEGCNYIVEEHKSRLIDENGKRYSSDLCDKYKKGKNVTGQSWKAAGMGRYK